TAGAMRSGRLCSSAGRQRTSSASQSFARRRAAISRASAPQAITSVRGVMFTGRFMAGPGGARLRPSSGARRACTTVRRAARSEQALGGLYRDGGITAVSIGTDGLAEFLVERSAADQHDEVIADSG